MTDLNGKVVLVTGSSRGIGAEIAVAFARQGAKVVLHGRDTEALANVQADITNGGGQAMFVTGDVTKFADLRSGRRVGCLRRRQRQPPRPDRGHRRGELAG
jgi:3-oxoacyl-[acyl-carrier protein] reductase